MTSGYSSSKARAHRFNVVVTGAWNPIFPGKGYSLQHRRDRLLDSIEYYARSDATERIVLADPSVSDADRAFLTARFPFVEIPGLDWAPEGEFSGPSYLEALTYRSLAANAVVAADDRRWIKVTGGYKITNLDDILGVVERRELAGLCFLHQHPLRIRPRWAMSAFYVLDGVGMSRFQAEVGAAAERARREPLEGFVLEFFRRFGAGLVRAPYPRVEAYMATSGLRSDSLKLIPHTLTWRALSAVGLYALALRRDRS